MRKVVLLSAVALMVSASAVVAAPLSAADGTDWKASWGGQADITDNGDGSMHGDLAGNDGSSGKYWRIPVIPSETYTLLGDWAGDSGGGGWAEVMLVTSTEGMDHGDIVGILDGPGESGMVLSKYDSWGLGPNPWDEDIMDSDWQAPAHTVAPNPMHATCAEIVVGLKVGNTAEYDITLELVPEPASALLLGLPLLLIRRRR